LWLWRVDCRCDHRCVVGTDEAFLAVAVEALRGAGFEPVLGHAPSRWSAGRSGLGAWIAVPGENANVVVMVADVLPDERGPGGWRAAYGRTAPAAVTGYQTSFHERPFRTRGHSYGDAAAYAYSVFIDDVVATVREWSGWEATWSVTPAVESPADRLARLRRLAGARRASAGVPVDIDVDPLMMALLDSAQADRVHRLVDGLFTAGIRWRFPRDNNGTKFATRTQVLLHECAPPAHPAGKGVWLVVDGPVPRAEQRLTVRLARAVGKSALHRWDRLPEYWHTGSRTLDILVDLQRVDAGRSAREVPVCLGVIFVCTGLGPRLVISSSGSVWRCWTGIWSSWRCGRGRTRSWRSRMT
jgi:hypothetical protein